MANQQAIEVNWQSIFSTLYTGEGHFSIWKQDRANGKFELRAEAGVSNGDPAIIWFVVEILDKHGISNHIRENSSDCFQVIVRQHEDILKLLDLVDPYLLGRKAAESALLRRFVKNRMKHKAGKGCKLSNEARKYTDADLAVVAEMEKLRESSETTRSAKDEIRALERYSPAQRETVGTN